MRKMHEKIIRVFKESEIQKLTNGPRMIESYGDVGRLMKSLVTIHSNIPEDITTLKSREQYLKERDIPYVVTGRKDTTKGVVGETVYTLWRERRIPDIVSQKDWDNIPEEDRYERGE